MRTLIKNEHSTWKESGFPRGKCHNKTETKTTISVYLDRKLVERAKNSRLNLSRVTEQALSSILDYMEAQNIQKSSDSPIQSSIKTNLWWAGPDSDRRPSARQADVLTRLDDRPTVVHPFLCCFSYIGGSNSEALQY